MKTYSVGNLNGVSVIIVTVIEPGITHTRKLSDKELKDICKDLNCTKK